jgi:hypothetical protein
VTREDIIARRRELQVPDQFRKQWVTLADVGFDGDWVSPIQKRSNNMKGPVLVAKHWLDAASVNQHRPVLERCGYVPKLRFNGALDRILKSVGLTRGDIYITQACHFLPRENRRQWVPRALMERSIEAVTRHEVEGRMVIALGREAEAALKRVGVHCRACPHPSSSVAGRDKALEDALRRIAH